jgi:hypothetical protein
MLQISIAKGKVRKSLTIYALPHGTDSPDPVHASSNSLIRVAESWRERTNSGYDQSTWA